MFDRLFNRRNRGLAGAKTEASERAVRTSLDELIRLRLQARQLGFNSRLPSSYLMAGNHVSRFKGRGMDYLESRAYQPGDDIRNMDWRITARTGSAHIKLFQEERERPVLIYIDLNPGMFFASEGRFKSVIAAHTAALLAWAANLQGDRVGGLIVNRTHVEIAPRANKNGLLNLLNELVRHTDPDEYLQHHQDTEQAEPLTPMMNEGFSRLLRMAKPGTRVFILSDFYQQTDESLSIIRKIQQRCECVLVRILDHMEHSPPPPNAYAVTDGIHESVIDTGNPDMAKHYQQWFAQKHSRIDQLSSQLAMPLINLSTDCHPVNELRKFFPKKTVNRKNLNA